MRAWETTALTTSAFMSGYILASIPPLLSLIGHWHPPLLGALKWKSRAEIQHHLRLGAPLGLWIPRFHPQPHLIDGVQMV
jgi:hypothetical protein